MSSHSEQHITSYKSLGIILITLLALTIVTITVTSIDLAAWSVGIALLIACVKVYFVLAYFMHLKYESILLKVLVGMVFLLFALVVVITYVDYLNR
jgi:cytochrome c oxidase subunit 4